ncbi:hypothetical protein [Microbacterium gorillae]|uniref:hypothetical protein n=1 Tax=Microbacterium gorillae TaxID=1231063 RepID=UPI003D962330
MKTSVRALAVSLLLIGGVVSGCSAQSAVDDWSDESSVAEEPSSAPASSEAPPSEEPVVEETEEQSAPIDAAGCTEDMLQLYAADTSVKAVEVDIAEAAARHGFDAAGAICATDLIVVTPVGELVAGDVWQTDFWWDSPTDELANDLTGRLEATGLYAFITVDAELGKIHFTRTPDDVTTRAALIQWNRWELIDGMLTVTFS